MTPPMTDDLVGRLRGDRELCGMERWPGYERQSWAERFAELDRRDREQVGRLQSAIIALHARHAARIEALEGENRDLKDSVVAFGAPWAVQYAKQCGLPDGHLHPTHFDILEAAGARMDAFTRAALAKDKSDG